MFHLEAGGDYLFAIPRLITPPATTVAPFSCARGVLEASARLLWLLDVQVDGTVRLGRSLALRQWGIDEQLKLYGRSEHAPEVEALNLRKQKIRQDAADRGVPVRLNGRRFVFGEGLPSATSLADKYLDAQGDYRFLSGVSHGQGPFMMSSSFKSTDNRNVMEKALDPLTAMYLLRVPSSWFARAVWAHLSYLGLADMKLREMLEHYYDQLGIDIQHRFWR